MTISEFSTLLSDPNCMTSFVYGYAFFAFSVVFVLVLNTLWDLTVPSLSQLIVWVYRRFIRKFTTEEK